MHTRGSGGEADRDHFAHQSHNQQPNHEPLPIKNIRVPSNKSYLCTVLLKTLEKMKKPSLWAAAFTCLFYLASCQTPDKKSAELFPDGSEIPAWFGDTAKVNSDTLGVQLVVTDFGAVGDGQTLNTEAIQKTIDEASDKGGGVVIIPEGTFLTGALFFKPHTHLHVREGATLLGSDDIANFPFGPSRMEGRSIDYFAAVINADGLMVLPSPEKARSTVTD